MKKDDLIDAIGEVDDRHIEKVEKGNRRGRRGAIRLLAAALALAVAIGGFAVWRRGTISASDEGLQIPAGVQRLAAAVYPDRVPYSDETQEEWQEWRDQRRELSLEPEDRAAFRHYLDLAVPAFLSGREGENAVCSPMNLFIGLAMLAETAGGETRQQLLTLLGQESVEETRALANRAWNALYVNDGVSKLELATSLWLRDGMRYKRSVLKTLTRSYYASAFSGEMGSEAYNGLLQDWLNIHTGNLLTQEAGKVELKKDTVMALVSAVTFKDKWDFNKDYTYRGDFHSPQGDVEVDYMYQITADGSYSWGDNFSAVIKDFERSKMVLILPDEAVTPEELLSDPEAVALLNGRVDSQRQRTIDVRLTLPRFDVRDDGLLDDALKSLGVTDAFDESKADFSPLNAAYWGVAKAKTVLSRVIQGARVKVDEDGCEGAAYAVFDMVDAAAPFADSVEWVTVTFDRPFLFAVLQDDLPVFAGIVNFP